MENKFLTIFILFACITAHFCQDFEPEPLFPEDGKTTTAATMTETSTMENVVSISTEQPTTDFQMLDTSTASTNEISTQGLEISTTPVTTSSSSSVSSTESLQISTTTAYPSTESNQSEPTTTYQPVCPTISSRPIQKCYFRKQQSRPQFYWTCEGPKWLYSMECFQCCRSENSAFAGCNQVHYSNCAQYN